MDFIFQFFVPTSREVYWDITDNEQFNSGRCFDSLKACCVCVCVCVFDTHLSLDTSLLSSLSLSSSPRARPVHWVKYDVALGKYASPVSSAGAGQLSFIVHRGDEQDVRVEHFSVTAGNPPAVWVVEGLGEVFDQEPDLTRLPRGDLSGAEEVQA